jgi:hypothetical protein
MTTEKETPMHSVQTGDVFAASWGYDQTNVDFYEVVSTTAKSVRIRKIGQTTVEDHGYSVRVLPERGNFLGESVTRRVRETEYGTYININSYKTASLHDGRSMHATGYGFGH